MSSEGFFLEKGSSIRVREREKIKSWKQRLEKSEVYTADFENEGRSNEPKNVGFL